MAEATGTSKSALVESCVREQFRRGEYLEIITEGEAKQKDLRKQQKVATPSPEKIITIHPRANILAAAGSPITAEVMDWDGADETVAVKIAGLSMSPKLSDGEVVLMRHRKDSRSPFMKKGLIYLVEYGGGYTVKRYNTRKATTDEKGSEWAENGKVKILESINPDFPEIIIKQELNWVAWLDEKA